MSEKTPTIREIAKASGYSRSTVSAALRNRPNIPPATRDKIRAIAGKMGYRRDAYLDQLMSHLSRRRGRRRSIPLAWLNDFPDPLSWHRFPWNLQLLEGVLARADELGYSVDEIWMENPPMTGRKLQKILYTRGITGLLLPNPQTTTRIEGLDYNRFACVQIGVDPWTTGYDVVFPDYFYNMTLVLNTLLEQGYRKPALCSHIDITSNVQNACEATYLMFAAHRRFARRIPMLRYKFKYEPVDASIEKWVEKYDPDVVICVGDFRMCDIIRNTGRKIPDDIGVVHLNIADDVAGWSGINQNSHMIGATAINLIAARVRLNEHGMPVHQQAVAVKGTWVDGKTTRPK